MTRRASSFVGLTSIAAIAGLAAAGPALAQQLGQGTDSGLPWWRVLGSLLLCLLLAGGATFVLRDRLPMLRGLAPLLLRRPAGRLRLVESTRIAQQVDVCLLRYDDRELLVAVSPQGAVLLSSQAAAVDPADETV